MRTKIGGGLALVVLAVLLAAAPALAHVTVTPTTADKGDYTTLTFSVPNETPAAVTTKVDIEFSPDHPIPHVTVKPKAGWTVDVRTKRLSTPLKTTEGDVTDVVTQIVWSGGQIAPGQFEDFDVSVGPLPTDVDVLVFPTIQTFSDGSEVKWTQQSFAGQAEPQNPAPQLTLASQRSKRASTTTTSNTTRNVAVGAFAIGAAALVVGGLAYIQVRRWR